MADTRAQIAAEDWVRNVWLQEKFGEPFFPARLTLDAGGVFDFDAVNASRSIAASISTSGSHTASGNFASGKMMKIRSDVLFLTMTPCARRLIVLTDRTMHEHLAREQVMGRLPQGIEFLHAPLPNLLALKLAEAQRAASQEVRPNPLPPASQ